MLINKFSWAPSQFDYEASKPLVFFGEKVSNPMYRQYRLVFFCSTNFQYTTCTALVFDLLFILCLYYWTNDIFTSRLKTLKLLSYNSLKITHNFCFNALNSAFIFVTVLISVYIVLVMQWKNIFHYLVNHALIWAEIDFT